VAGEDGILWAAGDPYQDNPQRRCLPVKNN
jgi:hypothetical protein